MQVKSIEECGKGSILQYFRPSLSYHLSFKIFVLSIFEWPFYTCFYFTVKLNHLPHRPFNAFVNGADPDKVALLRAA